jgi:tripartite-type tricarboxylate transporter receptor subunit TctC
MLKFLFAVCLTFFSLHSQSEINTINGPVRVIIPFPPGGGADSAFRHLQKYSEKRGINLLAVYKPGADGLIGMNDLRNSLNDGYTLAFATISTAAIHKIKNSDYEFDYVSIVRSSVMAIVSGNSFQIKNLDDFEITVRSSPALTFGYGSPSQRQFWRQYFNYIGLTSESILVPYKGSSPAIQDVIGNHVSFIVVPYSIAKTNIDSGKLNLIALSSRNLWADTTSNLTKKYPNWQSIEGFIIMLPANTPENMRTFWIKFIQTYLSDLDVLKDFKAEFTEIDIVGPEHAKTRVADVARYLLTDTK